MTDAQLPDIDAETGWSRAVIRLMARAIDEARRVEDEISWALYYKDLNPVLHISKRNICVMNPKRVELFVDVESVKALNLAGLGVKTKEMQNQWYPGLGKMTFPTNAAATIVDEVIDNHINAIRALAIRIKAPIDKRVRHDDSLRRKLNQIGDVDIPRPEDPVVRR